MNQIADVNESNRVSHIGKTDGQIKQEEVTLITRNLRNNNLDEKPNKETKIVS